MRSKPYFRRVGGSRGGRRNVTPFYPGVRPLASEVEQIRAALRDYARPSYPAVRTSGGTGNRDEGGNSAVGLQHLEQFFTSAEDGQWGVDSGDVPDGVRTDFTLDFEPLDEEVAIFINGLHHPEVDYTVSGAVISFAEAPRADMFISGIYLR